MRIAVLILGLLLGLLMFFQTFLVYALSGMGDDDLTGQAAAVGFLMAIMWLFASAVVIPLPRIAMFTFIVAGILGFAASGEFPDLAAWGGVSFFLAVLSFFGWRGKRKNDIKEQARDDWMRQMAERSGERPPA